MNQTRFLLYLTACIGIYVWGAFAIPLMDIDASQYASISRAMLESKSYLQIFDLGKDYLDKPPMLFWMSALSMKLLGVYDWAYRLPSLLFLGIALYATFKFTLLFYNVQIARLATLILASCQAFFLIAHDVRTDTMLVGWVMLSIWLLAKWMSNNKNIYFFVGMVAIAGGMMTKGPIALIIPILCFVPYWITRKDWAYFYKPIYLLGVVLIAILLLPMSIGLYQQYDLHPGKLINGTPIQSGLRFYYWTQSFGRFTGENHFHEMGYFTFLLENMFWSFLPWIFIFLWALIAKGIGIAKEGFFSTNTERISFYGFILTYLVLSRSQAQLPHYIFVVFPLAAILTAAHLHETLFSQKTIVKPVKYFYHFHLFIFSILLIAIIWLAIVPFGMIGIAGKLLFLIVIIFALNQFSSKQLVGQKWFNISMIIILGVNLFMNSFFYPHLLDYQWGSHVAKVMEEKKWDKEKLVAYKMPNSNALHFYGQYIFPVILDSAVLKEGQFVVTDFKNAASIQSIFPKSVLLYRANRFHVTMLTIPFLNPSTRNAEVTPFGVFEIKK